MRPVLLEFAGLSTMTCVWLFALCLLIVSMWLGWMYHRHVLTGNHWRGGATVLGVAVLILLGLHVFSHIRINSYGALLGCGSFAGILTGIALGKRRGITAEHIVDLALLILVGALVGARIAYVLQTPGEPWLNLPQALQQGIGGLSFHGGLIGGIAVGMAYTAIRRLSFWRVADSLAPGVAIGYSITRIGCFLNGCCYGVSAPSVPWAMTFLHSPDGPHYHVHPTQLYASLMGLIMFGLLLLLARGASLRRAGRLFMALLILEGIERFVMEIYRAPMHPGTLTLAQYVSMGVATVGVVGWFLLPNRTAIVVEEPLVSPLPPRAILDVAQNDGEIAEF